MMGICGLMLGLVGLAYRNSDLLNGDICHDEFAPSGHKVINHGLTIIVDHGPHS